MEPRRQTIPIILLVKTAFQLLWQQRDDALRLGLVPTLLLFGGLVYSGDAIVAFLHVMQSGIPAELPAGIAGPMLIFWLTGLVGISLLTVNWLRFLLLGPMGAVGIGLSIGIAHVRFVLAAIAFMFGMLVATAVLSLPIAFLTGVPAVVGRLLVAAAVMVLAARFLPYLIGRAIGQSMSPAQSWKVSRGNGVSLAVSLILVQLPVIIALMLLQFVLGVTGFTTLAPVGTTFIFSVGQVAVWLCFAGVMATAYRHMVGVRV